MRDGLGDLGRVHAKRYTDNVVDLMVAKLNRLPPETRQPLHQLACVGNGAEIAMLWIGSARRRRKSFTQRSGKPFGPGWLTARRTPTVPA